MGTVSFSGFASVSDRVLFTNKGPIVKRPFNLLSGINLKILSENEIEIPTGSFTSLVLEKNLIISGSSGARNDGTFRVKEVKSSTRLLLQNASFYIGDDSPTIAEIVELTNEIRGRYNAHRIQIDVHGTNDTVNVINLPMCGDLPTAIILLNDLKVKFGAHIVDISSPGPGQPQVHLDIDDQNTVYSPNASDIDSAYQLANELRKRYSFHRQSNIYHENPDSVNAILVNKIVPTVGTFPGPLTGPFPWTLQDPRIGEFADDPSDVNVFVNAVAAGVDEVFGLLGAVVLTTKPGGTDTVQISYDWLNNPNVLFSGLNFPGFVLNQAGNHGLGGLPGHKYRMKSFLIDPETYPNPHGIASPFSPRRVGWRYKGLERAYTASLNEPNLLKLNSPTNKILFPTSTNFYSEVSISYDPKTLPQNAIDPWVSEGSGSFTLTPNGDLLTIVDPDTGGGTQSEPPYFSHEISIQTPSIVSSAFRVSVVENNDLIYDGVFTGVGFGISDGEKIILTGFIKTNATNLSSALTLANSIKTKFNAHLVQPTIHFINDTSNFLDLVDATNLAQLLVLVNALKAKFNAHITKTPNHVIPDTVNTITTSDAGNIYSEAISLQQAIDLVNEIKNKINAHFTQFISIQVHQVNDTINTVQQIKQIGVLTNSGPWEFESNWSSYSSDWTSIKSYRIQRSSNGDVSIFLSGFIEPIITVTRLNLPATSDLDIKINEAQLIIFGSVSKESASVSNWAFIRTIVSPVNPNQIGRNKSVNYNATVTPELETVSPWITIGQEGIERINGSILTLDSTASSANTNNIPSFGLSSGAYRGFLRFEPTQLSSTTTIIEFRTKIDYYTFGVNNTAAGVFLDDQNLQVHFSFLQFSPSPPSVLGGNTEPFPIVSGDDLTVSIDGDVPVTIIFAGTDTTAALVVAKINANPGVSPGFAVAESGKVRLIGPVSGAESSIQILGGRAATKLGFIAGIYFGTDSTPEKRISYFGANFPNLDQPVWIRSGNQTAELIGRTLRITDDNTSDFLLYDISDPLITSSVISASENWKLDARISVVSFTPSYTFIITAPYVPVKFCGAFINIDEGVGGRNLEVHLSIDTSGNKYVTILSVFSNAYKIVFQAAFDWSDGAIHTYNIFTNKSIALAFVLIDGQPVNDVVTLTNSFFYPGLHPSISGPSITFGSGSSPIGAINIDTAKSVVDWHSIFIFKDTKLTDPNASLQRFVGLYKGGDPAFISSYYLHQVDWTSFHTYRIVRDPVDSVSIYVDTNPIPVISTNYDSLRLPQIQSSFITPITDGIASVSFGSFNPQELVRTEWDFVRYSIGKIISMNRIVPRHHLLNYANPVSSPDHLFTQKFHYHSGKRIYSEGTPNEELLADPEVESFTVLGENTPPVPMTQDLDFRGGLVKNVTQTKTIDPLDFANSDGTLTSFEDDTTNALVSPVSTDLATSITLLNEIKTKFNLHLSQYRVHVKNDTINVIILDDSTNLVTAQDLANDVKIKLNTHLSQSGIHTNNDLANVVLVADATNLATLTVLVNDIRAKYEAHRIPLASFANDLRDKFNAHLSYVFSKVQPYPILNDTLDIKFGNSTKIFTINFLADTTAFLVATRINTTPGIPSGTASVSGFNVRINNPSINFVGGTAIPKLDFIHFNASTFVGGNAIDQLSAIDLLNEIKYAFNAHFIQNDVHLANDSVNTILSSNATNFNSGMTLALELQSKFVSHKTSLVFHNVSDTENNTSAFISVLQISDVHLSTVIIRLDAPDRVLYQRMKFYTFPEGDERRTFPFSDDETLHISGTTKYAGSHTIGYEGRALPENQDELDVVNLVNDIKYRYNLHRTQVGVHPLNDVFNVESVIDATTFASALVLLNDLKAKYNSHLIQVGVHIANDTSNKAIDTNAIDIGTALALVNELKFRFENHRISTTYHLVADSVNKIQVPDAPPVANPGWLLESSAPGNVSRSLNITGYLNYATVGSSETVEKLNIGLPDTSGLDMEMEVRIRINAAPSFSSTYDSRIYAGFLSSMGGGIAPAIGFEAINGIQYVKIHDVNSDQTVYRTQLDWSNGEFHRLKLVRDVRSNSINLVIIGDSEVWSFLA